MYERLSFSGTQFQHEQRWMIAHSVDVVQKQAI